MSDTMREENDAAAEAGSDLDTTVGTEVMMTESGEIRPGTLRPRGTQREEGGEKQKE